MSFKSRFASARAVVAVISSGSLLEEGLPREGGWGRVREWRIGGGYEDRMERCMGHEWT